MYECVCVAVAVVVVRAYVRVWCTFTIIEFDVCSPRVFWSVCHVYRKYNFNTQHPALNRNFLKVIEFFFGPLFRILHLFLALDVGYLRIVRLYFVMCVCVCVCVQRRRLHIQCVLFFIPFPYNRLQLSQHCIIYQKHTICPCTNIIPVFPFSNIVWIYCNLRVGDRGVYVCVLKCAYVLFSSAPSAPIQSLVG